MKKFTKTSKKHLASKNRKSFIFIPQLDEKSNTVTARIIRVKQNRPVVIGLAETALSLSDFQAMQSQTKKGFVKLMALLFLKKRGEISKYHIDGINYILEGI